MEDKQVSDPGTRLSEGIDAELRIVHEQVILSLIIFKLTDIGIKLQRVKGPVFPERDGPVIGDAQASKIIGFARESRNYQFLRMISREARFSAFFSETARELAGKEMIAALDDLIDHLSEPDKDPLVVSEREPGMAKAKRHFTVERNLMWLEEMLEDDIPERAKARVRKAIKKIDNRPKVEEEDTGWFREKAAGLIAQLRSRPATKDRKTENEVRRIIGKLKL